jgi:hypothetical protein
MTQARPDVERDPNFHIASAEGFYKTKKIPYFTQPKAGRGETHDSQKDKQDSRRRREYSFVRSSSPEEQAHHFIPPIE